MTGQKLLFVFNPASGKAQIKNELMNIIDIFVKGGYEVSVYPTQRKNDAFYYICENGSRFDTVVVSGGDGTLNEAINGLMSIDTDNRPKFGYIPTGTVNDFATSLSISKKCETAANDIISGEAFSFDVGKFKKRYFAYVAAFGAFTDVPYETPQQSKNIWGNLAYIGEGIKRLPQISPSFIRVEADGKVIEGEFLLGLVSNSNSIAGMKTIGNKNVSLNDGLFEVTLIRNPENPLSVQFMLSDLLQKKLDSKYIYNFKTSKIKFNSKESISWTLDGEYGGTTKRVVIENIKEAIDIRVRKK